MKMKKNSVLTLLRAQTQYRSGEEISRLLGISRTSVNNAIKALRQEGYSILSCTNKGYLLQSAPDSLSNEELSIYLPAERMNTVLCLPCVDSTNTYLKAMLLEGAADGQVVLANEQTGGRGRFGRSFASPKDQGIYLSMLFCPKGPPADAAQITAWTAVAVCRAIQDVCGICIGIKWINDLILNQKKVGGILTELCIEGESGQVQAVIIGIGINVNEQDSDLPEEIQNIASSLFLESGKSYRRAKLAARLIEELDRMRTAWPLEKDSFLQQYRASSITVGKKITVIHPSGQKNGVACRINDDFSLQVCYEDGSLEALCSGEVSIRNTI